MAAVTTAALLRVGYDRRRGRGTAAFLGGVSLSERKGVHPLVWVGIGCAVLVVLAGVGVVAAGWFVKNKAEELVDNIENRPVETAARAFAALNPEVEFVSADEAAETVTLRNTKTNEEITIDYADLKEGRVTFQGEDGTTTFDTGGEEGVSVSSPDGTFQLGGGDLPPWVPRPDGVETQASFTNTGADGQVSGTFTLTGRAPAEVTAFYRETLPAQGYALESSSNVSGVMESLVYANSSTNRRISVVSSPDQGTVAVTYEGQN
jgi:hypothetical protein